jgi:hypothetical protein
VIRGGIGLFYDQINLNVATASQLQDRVVTRYGLDGLQVVGLPEHQRFALTESRLQTPRSLNWNIELDREWLKNFFVRVGYQQRQATREFILNPTQSTSGETILGWITPGGRAIESLKSRRATGSASTMNSWPRMYALRQ